MKRTFAIPLYLISTAVVLLNASCESPQHKKPKDVEPNSYYETGWAVGHWVRYDYTVSGIKSSVYLAITDSEIIGDEMYFWLETVKQNGTVITATRQLVVYFDSESFLKTSGGLLPGSTRYIAKPAFAPPAEKPLIDGRESPIIDYGRLFGGHENVEIISIDENAEYTALSGKYLVCAGKILLLDEKNVGSVLTTRDVPITGIAYADGLNRKLEIVDFGFSGAGTIL